MMKNQKGSSDAEALFYVGAFILILLFAGIAGSRWFLFHDTITATVTEKGERCKSRDEGCKYLIYTNKGTLENTDSILSWKWNSSDIYGALEKGKTYTFNTSGARVPFFSWYPNINSYTEVK